MAGVRNETPGVTPVTIGLMSRTGCVVVLAGVLAGCPSGDDDGPPQRPDVDVTIEAPDVIEIEGNVTIPLTVTVTRPDGSPASGYTIALHTDCITFPACTILVMPSEGTGTETIYFHPTDFSTGYIFARATFGDLSVDSESHFVIAIPSVGDKLQAAVTEVYLAPGEQRPVAAVTWSTGGPTGAWQSATRPSYATDDSAVATVDALGIVTGVAAGTTTLRLSAGNLTSSIPITVDDRLLIAPPPDGISTLYAFPKMNNVKSIGPASARAAHGIVVDRRGYPFAIAAFGDSAVLVGWTGTGYGTEMMPDGFDLSQSAAITIDGNDRLYVTTSGQFGLVHVYDRLSTQVGASTWQRRVLPYKVPAIDDVGGGWLGYLRTTTQTAVSILPAFGDGFEIAHHIVADLRGFEFLHECASIYRYAKVTATTIESSDIGVDEFDLPAGGPCDVTPVGSGPVWQQWSLFRAADGSTQFIIPNGNRAYRAEASFWTGEAIYARDGNGVWSTAPGTVNTNGGHFPVQTDPVSINVADAGFTANGTPIPSRFYKGLATVTQDGPFVFSERGNDWVGTRLLGAMTVHRPDGSTTGENFASEFWEMPSTGIEFENWTVTGATARHRRAHLAATESVAFDAFEVMSITLPAYATTRSPEANGRLAAGSDENGAVYTPEITLPDGTRLAWIYGSDAQFHIARSDGIDQPWTQLADGVAFHAFTGIYEGDGAIYTFDTAQVLQRSTDRGSTFSPVTGAVPEMIGPLTVNASGAVVDAGPKLTYAKLDATAATSPFASVTLATAAPNGGSIGTDIHRRVHIDADGFTFIAESLAGAAAPTLYVARYTWAGVRTSEAQLTNLDGIAGETFDLAGAAIASDGALVFTGTSPGIGWTIVRGHRVDLASGVWNATTLASTVSSTPTSILSLDDGRLVVAAGVFDLANSLSVTRRTMMFSTMNGSTWTSSSPARISVKEMPGALRNNGSGGVTLVVTGTARPSDTTPNVQFVLQTEVP